jgi:hypothetical protein
MRDKADFKFSGIGELFAVENLEFWPSLRVADHGGVTRFENARAFELSRCAADAAAWATIDVRASQNLGW